MFSDLQKQIGDLADEKKLVVASIDLADDEKIFRFAVQILLAHYWFAIDRNLRQSYGEDVHSATWSFLIDENVQIVDLVVFNNQDEPIDTKGTLVWEYPDIDVEFLHCYRVSSWFADKKTLVKGI